MRGTRSVLRVDSGRGAGAGAPLSSGAGRVDAASRRSLLMQTSGAVAGTGVLRTSRRTTLPAFRSGLGTARRHPRYCIGCVPSIGLPAALRLRGDRRVHRRSSISMAAASGFQPTTPLLLDRYGAGTFGTHLVTLAPSASSSIFDIGEATLEWADLLRPPVDQIEDEW